jgi:UDP-2,3-diacylglucosamine pyrophosphatase LpxH
MPQITRYRTICISDIHLGSRHCQARVLMDFLDHNDADRIYLVGDIVDAWKIHSNKWRWTSNQSGVIQKILKKARHDTQIVWILGNHDEFLRPYLQYNLNFGNIEIANQWEHTDAQGRRWLLTHGDLFDGISRVHRWVSLLGDSAYDFVLWINTHYNHVRHRLGFGYWSMAKFLKHRVKKAVDFIYQFESNLATYCRKRGFDGVICGHIHAAEIKEIDGVIYMNDGDWVDSCTALVEDHSGDWRIIHWTKGAMDVDTLSDGGAHQ